MSSAWARPRVSKRIDQLLSVATGHAAAADGVVDDVLQPLAGIVTVASSASRRARTLSSALETS